MKVSRKTFEGVLHMMPAALSKFFSSVSASVNRLFWKVGFSSYGRLTGKQKLSTLKPLSSSNQATASSSSVTSPAPLSKPEKLLKASSQSQLTKVDNYRSNGSKPLSAELHREKSGRSIIEHDSLSSRLQDLSCTDVQLQSKVSISPNTITEAIHVDESDWTGYKIVTGRQTVTVMIDNYAQCCEDWGVEISSKDIIGQEITLVEWARSLPDEEKRSWETPFQATVLVKTDKKDIFITAWNVHEGYYPHSYKVKWADYEDSDYI